jgi:hypothetical protein
MGRQGLGVLRELVLGMAEILGKKLGRWGHFRQGHDCRVLKVSIRRGKMGWWQKRELRMRNHLLLVLMLLLLNIHSWQRVRGLLIGGLHGHHVWWVGLHSEGRWR